MTRLLPCCLSMFALLATTACAAPSAIAPFASDGCSEFPNGLPQYKALWLACCIQHDKVYWQGGTYKERWQADETLRQCVTAVGQLDIARLMLAGVRVGGSPYWPTRYRWGYGWPWPRGYAALTPDERAQAQALMAEYEKALLKMVR